MRGKQAFLFASILLSFTCFLFLHNISAHAPSTEETEMEQGEKEDGIKIIQQHEFDITKDPALGFIPKYRLIQANVRLLKQRKARENSTSQTQGFNWIERGPYADVVGADNVNTRSGAPAP